MLWICKGCRTAYSVDAPSCPHCKGTEHVEQGEEHLLDELVAGEQAMEPVEVPAGSVVSRPKRAGK